MTLEVMHFAPTEPFPGERGPLGSSQWQWMEPSIIK